MVYVMVYVYVTNYFSTWDGVKTFYVFKVSCLIQQFVMLLYHKDINERKSSPAKAQRHSTRGTQEGCISKQGKGGNPTKNTDRDGEISYLLIWLGVTFGALEFACCLSVFSLGSS